jgi:hypothetical protein
MDSCKVFLEALFVPAKLPVLVCSMATLSAQLTLAREAIEELRVAYPESTPSNVHAAYMSPWRSHQLNKKFGALCDSVVTIAKVGAANYLTGNLDALNMDLVVVDCWGAIYQGGDHAERHNHFPADFGCVVYLEADDNCAPIIFGGSTSVQPTAGMCIVFPGILDHEVPATAANRIVVSMNLYKKSCIHG